MLAIEDSQLLLVLDVVQPLHRSLERLEEVADGLALVELAALALRFDALDEKLVAQEVCRGVAGLERRRNEVLVRVVFFVGGTTGLVASPAE